MERINFNRFKNKSLLMLHKVIDNAISLKKILNYKIIKTLQILHFKQGIVEEKTLEGHPDSVLRLIKINEYQIASCSLDNTIKIWDVITGNCLKTLNGHLKEVVCLIMINENLIVSGSTDECIKIWDVITGNCINTLIGTSQIVLCLLKINENKIASGSFLDIKIWDVITGNCIKSL